MVFKAENFIFFRTGVQDQDTLDAIKLVYESVSLPLVTLYRGPEGNDHLDAACENGAPFQVKYLDVIAESCGFCHLSPAYLLLQQTEDSLMRLTYVVKEVNMAKGYFQECKDKIEGRLSLIGVLLRTLDSSSHTISAEEKSGLDLSSFTGEYRHRIETLQTAFKTFLQTDDTQSRISKEIEESLHGILLQDATAIFCWKTLNGVYRTAAEAYGTNIGDGKGYTSNPHAVSIMAEAPNGVIILPDAASVSEVMLETAAKLWEPKNSESIFSDGTKLFEAAKILTGSTPSI